MQHTHHGKPSARRRSAPLHRLVLARAALLQDQNVGQTTAHVSRSVFALLPMPGFTHSKVTADKITREQHALLFC
jgi:hypothetical protein